MTAGEMQMALRVKRLLLDRGPMTRSALTEGLTFRPSYLTNKALDTLVRTGEVVQLAPTQPWGNPRYTGGRDEADPDVDTNRASTSATGGSGRC